MIFKEGLTGFGRIHHRFLNDLTLLERFRSRPPSPHLTEVAEGDLCWYVNGSEIVAAFVHPSGLNRIPTLNEIRTGIERGSIAQLDDVLDRRFDDIPLVVELKTGIGNVTRAMEYILDRLEGAALGRYWVDSFSPGLLATVKKVSPGTPTSLHTRLGVYGPIFIKTSFEAVPVAPKLLAYLDQADAITVTYKYSPARFLKGIGATIDGIHSSLAHAGKFLILGGVDNQEVFDEAESSSAVAAYVKWELDEQ